jgi:hypothetical protein
MSILVWACNRKVFKTGTSNIEEIKGASEAAT